MKFCNKTLLSVSLICYIAVSSIAAVHAFPTALPTSSDNNASMSTSMPTAMPCHQLEAMSVEHAAQDDVGAISISNCEIFCAAIGHALSHEFAYLSSIVRTRLEIAFIQPGVYKTEHLLEPHPPK